MMPFRILIFGSDATLHNELGSLLSPAYLVTHIATLDALHEALQAHDNLMLIFALCPEHPASTLAMLREVGNDVPLVCVAREPLPVPLINALLDVNLKALIQHPFQADTVRKTVANALRQAHGHRQRKNLELHLAQANQQLNQRLQEINTIYTVGKFVTSSLHVDEVLERIVDVAVNLTQAEEGFIVLQEGEKLYLRIAKNMNEEIVKRFYIEASDPIAWQVIRSGRPTMLDRDTKIATGYLVRSLLYVPLHVAGQGTIGVLGVVNLLANRSFTENHLFTLSSIADYAATALENARLFSVVEEERSRLSAILEHAAEAILVTDVENKLWLWSEHAAESFDIPPEARGQKIERYIDNIAICDLFSRAGEDADILHAEVALANGRTYNVQLSSINHIGRVAVMQDITHLKELNRLKSEFVSTVSHDLRTPLTTIQGYIELLERVGPLSER